MTKGRKVPPEIKKQNGTWRDDRHLPDAAHLNPVSKIPMPPKSLPKAAHGTWYIQAAALADMRILTTADYILLESFCIEKMKYDRATVALEDEDMIDETNNGSTKMVNLYVKVQNDALNNMLNLSKRFGFDPLSRMDIGAAKSDNADPLKKYIKE